ncbi:MAG: RlpA-like double-psi beta-barrel domain-containing protein [Patescibacteria group bacterium]|nr:RlpA-like double-psi beta-barrel domain-containing protein [Patescibacteria group bacterium]
MIKNCLRKTGIIAILLTLLVGSFVFADEVEPGNANQYYSINLDKATIAKGYTVAAFNNELKLSLVPGILSEATGVEIAQINENMPTPWQLDRISNVYQFEFKNKAAYDDNKPFYIQFAYSEEGEGYKQVFFYDRNFNSWRPLPTKDYPEEKFIRSLIHLPFARIAVFSHPEIPVVGRASWYAYKNGDFAASPDFPKGSKLRVYNTANSKFVDVEINDYGPDRNLHPDRVIDLDKIAFARIASLGEGVINVRVEPLKVIPDAYGRTLGIAENGAAPELAITSKSAIVMDEDSEEILLEKNATSTLPLASLTKLVAIKVFLDTRPSLDAVVTYKVQDEEFNYQYCNKWESAKVTLKDGDTLTVENLVYSALVGSANNAIETLVRVSGLSREEFIKKMNETVVGWGATSTHFTEPTGLSPENVSSALDYAIITKKIFVHPIIEKASLTKDYKFSTLNTKKPHRLRNTNKLLEVNNGFAIAGSKTGYLDEAGYCLMIRAKVGNRRLIAVTFGSGTRDGSFIETGDLIKYVVKKIIK